MAEDVTASAAFVAALGLVLTSCAVPPPAPSLPLVTTTTSTTSTTLPVDADLDERWRFIGTAHDGALRYYYDARTVTRRGPRVRFWILMVERWGSKKGDWEVDCRQRTMRSLRFIEHHRDGTVQYSEATPTAPFATPVPDSIGEDVVELWCD